MRIDSFLSKVLSTKTKDTIKKTLLFRIYVKLRNARNKEYPLSPEYLRAVELISRSQNMVDLGCGNSPHPNAKVAVDKYIEPVHRKFGGNKKIDVAEIEKQGIRFVEADFESLPFKDKEFDVAYSHHVVEHLEDPVKGLLEMQRIARGGVIMSPSIFAEYMFSRKYHKWMIAWQGTTLIFIEKNWDNLWFGEGPHRENGKVVFPKDGNPFDALLNESNWYHGIHKWKRLTDMMKKYWFGHYKIMETCFVWEGSFDFLIIYKNGNYYSSKEHK